MKKQRKYLLFLYLIIAFGPVVFYEFQFQKDRHERLATFGKKVQITLGNYYNSLGNKFIKYYFVASSGKKIEGSFRCDEKLDYVEFLNTSVIYNPDDPAEYDLDYIYDGYNLKSITIYYFLICLPALSLFAMGVVHFLSVFIKVLNLGLYNY